ncbi:MAG: NAD(P)/FAD-dependent oxidoreductase, partial [Deinococcota bacterium]
MIKQALTAHEYDVAIIGSGIAGSSLAMILARQGLEVLLLEGGCHPRFAIGESMILETSEMMRALAELYDVPELAYFSSENYLPVIGSSHGVKRHFGFLHHQEGQHTDVTKALQAVIPKQPHGHELHLFRQDSDAFLANSAVSYGVTLLQNSRVEAINVQKDGVVLTTLTSNYRAKYVVDASGFKSPLAEQYNLRMYNLKTHSRTIFTHMVNVGNIHDTLATTASTKLPFDMTEGTLHHVFAGGWLWVIPFNNHANATNPLCSVGLMLDPRVHPQQAELSPEEEFKAFMARFPDIQLQFVNAKAVRPWVRTGRIQYSSKQVVGDRWALLGQAAGFVDPLFSKGLYTSLTCVSVLADLLLQAQQDGDYSRQRFRPLEDKTLAFINTNDRLVAGAYKAFNDHSLWHSYSVLWLLGAYTELVKLMQARITASASDERAEYYRETAALELAGGGFMDFKRLADRIDAKLDSTVITDAAQVQET